jgi:O-antigen/teichoic acid export membrane protein
MAAEAGARWGTAVPGLWRSGTAVLGRLRSQAARRLGWGVADQAVSSLTNFAVSIYIARTLGAAQFGAFSLAYVTYGFALNASRGLATDPLMVRFSGTDLPTWRRAVADCTGTSIVAGLATGICVLAAAAVLHGPARLAFLALGLTLPGLMLQDSWRFGFFALGRGSQAFLNDIIWGAALLPALVLLRSAGHANVFWFVFAWGATATVAAAVGPLQARVVPRLLGTRRWLSRHRDLGARYFAEGTANSAAAQLRNYGVGLILGLVALGYLQAASTLMGPFQVILYGMGLVALPEAARILRNSPRHMPLFCVLLSAGLTLLGLVWGVTLLVALPRGLGEWLLGSLWRPTYPLVLPTALFLMGACAGAGAGTWLHALGAAKRSLRAAVLTSAIYVVCALVGAVADGALGSIRGAALGTWIGALVYWWQLRAALRESGHAPADYRVKPGPSSGRHRIIPGAALTPPSDLSVPLDSMLSEAGSSPVTTQRPVRPARRVTRTAAVALVTGVMALLTVAAAVGWVLAYQSPGTHETAPARAPKPVAKPAPTPVPTHVPVPGTTGSLRPAGATSFDPYGDSQGENGQLAGLAIDASPATAWHSDWYTTARFGNLKPGTGLIFDMGHQVAITGAVISLGNTHGADFQLRVGESRSSLGDLQPVARATDAGGREHLQLTKPAHARYILVWFTKLPPDNSGTFQVSVYNVRLEGWK